MSIFSKIGKVNAAQARVKACRSELSTPAAALLVRGYRHPITTVGTAAGAGLVLGVLGVGPLRVPGLSSLLSGGMARAVAYGTQIIAEMVAANNDNPTGDEDRDDDATAPAADDSSTDDTRTS